MTESMQTEREAFEAWARKNLLPLTEWTDEHGPYYAHEQTYAAWGAWKECASELRSLRDALHLAKSRIAELEGGSLAYLRTLIADDSYAMTFQTFGQYRTALLKAIDAASAALKDHEGFWDAETRAVEAWNHRDASELRSLRDALALARSHIGELTDALAARCGTNAAEWPLIDAARAALKEKGE